MRSETVGGQEPEFGYPQLAQLLRRADVTDQDANVRDMRELFCRMVFNILIDNTDDHEKTTPCALSRRLSTDAIG